MGVQTEIDRIADAKMAIKAAIEGKGVTVPDGTPIDEYAGKIGEIQSGSQKQGYTVTTDSGTISGNIFCAITKDLDVLTTDELVVNKLSDIICIVTPKNQGNTGITFNGILYDSYKDAVVVSVYSSAVVVTLTEDVKLGSRMLG